MPTGETIRKINVGGTEHDVVGSAEALWGSIQGSLTSQTDLVEALGEKQDVLTFDNTPTAGSNNPVESGGIKTALDAKYDKALANELGAKNLLPLSNFSVVGTGVTWTINDDGTVTANGTAGGTTDARLDIIIPTNILFGDFYMSGCPGGGSSTTYDVYCWDTTAGARARRWDGTTTSESDYGGTSAEIKLVKGHNTRIGLRVMNGATANNIKFKPMIRLGTDIDDTFYPAAQSNRGLTLNKCDNSVIAPVELGVTASRAYAIGEHFIRNGAFCTAKTAIASGAAFTLDTNYTAGNVGDMLSVSSFSNIGSLGVKGYKYGMIATVDFEAMTGISSAISAGSTILTLPVELRPNSYVGFLETLNKRRMTIGANGNVTCSDSLSQGAVLRGSVTYITKS